MKSLYCIIALQRHYNHKTPNYTKILGRSSNDLDTSTYIEKMMRLISIDLEKLNCGNSNIFWPLQRDVKENILTNIEKQRTKLLPFSC